MIAVLLRVLATMLAVWSGLVGLPSGSISPPATDARVAVDTHVLPVIPHTQTRIASERGPPIYAYSNQSTHDAVAPGPHGALARLKGVTTPAITTYATSRSLVQVAEATTTTDGHVVLAEGDLPAVHLAGVAAKGADEAGALVAADELARRVDQAQQALTWAAPTQP